MSSELVETRSIYEDNSGYKFRIYWDAVRDTYITGVTVNFEDAPANIEQLEIFIESEVQQYRNEIDYSKR